MSSQHIATAAVVKISIGSPSGNRVAQFIQRGGIIPEGVDEEQLKRLVKRGLVSKEKVEKTDTSEKKSVTPEKKSDKGGSPDEGVYKGVTVADLKVDLAKRNEGREGDAVIAPADPGNRPEIVAALLADDANSK